MIGKTSGIEKRIIPIVDIAKSFKDLKKKNIKPPKYPSKVIALLY